MPRRQPETRREILSSILSVSQAKSSRNYPSDSSALQLKLWRRCNRVPQHMPTGVLVLHQNFRLISQGHYGTAGEEEHFELIMGPGLNRTLKSKPESCIHASPITENILTHRNRQNTITATSQMWQNPGCALPASSIWGTVLIHYTARVKKTRVSVLGKFGYGVP
jgi:hypothetical protein